MKKIPKSTLTPTKRAMYYRNEIEKIRTEFLKEKNRYLFSNSISERKS